MKVNLIFKLPEETEEYETVMNGWKYKACWTDLYSKLRSKDKYEDVSSLTIDEIKELIADIEKEYFD